MPHTECCESVGDLCLHVLGTPRSAFLPVLHEARRERGLPFEGFADWSAEVVADRTGLPLARARLALERRGTEPPLWSGDADGLRAFAALLAREGLDLVAGGRFHHVSSGSDKGRALAWLRSSYADAAVVVPARTPRPFEVGAPRVLRPEHEGPRGWNEAVLEILRAADR